MAAARKLQQEIDKTLKKVQEGCELFDELWEQLHESEYQNQRDKFESELKKEIKRLQRYRDQIKSWIASSDVKDKKLLIEARKSVEREMERFKAAERDSKTKAFSKEGLIQAAKLDPKSKARQEARDWLNSTVDKLNNQIDELEAELEASGRSRKKQSRLSQNEVIIGRHQEHIQKLEQVLRLLDNEQLEPDDLEDLKDFLDDYIERNQEDPDEFEDVEYFYEGVADKFESTLATVTSINKRDKEDKKAKAQAEKEKEEREQQKAEAAAAAALKTAEKSSLSSSSKSSSGKTTEVTRPIDSSNSQKSAYSQQASRLINSEVSDSRHGPKQGNNSGVGSAPAKHGGMGWNGGFPHARMDAHEQQQQDRQPDQTQMSSNANAAFAAAASESHYSQLQGGHPLAHKGGDMQQQAQYQYQQDSSGSNQQSRYGDLGGSQNKLQFRHNAHSIPQEQDRTWRSKASRGKTVSVPASYPSTQPLALIRDPSIYERFDGETLFFAFYYQPGTYNQHLAARALKKKNWRFNKQHNAWFQRLKEPLFVTAEHEQGSYIWFDYHMIHEDGTRGWRPRVKENFVFEYKELVD